MEDEEEDSQLLSSNKAAIIGAAEVFLRPLRFMFDVETDIAVVAHTSIHTATTANAPNDDKDTDDALGHVHVHLMIASCPPLIERQQTNGFLRAVRPSGRHGSNEFDDYHTCDNDVDPTLKRIDAHLLTTDDEEGELRGLRGSFVWLLVRMQQSEEQLQQQLSRELRSARVQYQVTPATESYLLPINHTNVIKLLVTDELLDQIDTKTLEFTFLSSPSPLALPTPQNSAVYTEPPASPPPVTIATAKSEAKDHHDDANDHDKVTAKSYKAEMDAKELERARLAALEHEAKAAAATLASQQAGAALEHERAQFRLHVLELQHEKSALGQQHERERELLKQELQRREEQNSQLAQLTKQLEDQLQGKQEFMSNLQQTTQKTDNAIELLKQRMAGDAKECEELQRRLRALEDEKLELLKKSRACALQ